jgi:predicted TIM-barrel fold metal-dependent hydrolase
VDHSFTVIDADAHHLDAPAYKSYLPERFRARSGPYFPSFGWDIFLNGTTGRKPSNPEEYCRDLDVENIADAVAYPSNALAIGLVRELDLAVELAKAYNNWAQDFCQSTGHRVKYAAVIAPQVITEAVKEIRRAVTEKDAVGVMMPTYVQSGLDLGQPEFDPIYAAAPGPRGASRFSCNRPGCGGQHTLSQVSRRAYDVPSVRANALHHCRDLQRRARSLPKAQSGFPGSRRRLLPYWMERFDEKYLKRKSEMAPLKMLPSEYVKNNRCYFTCEGEESALPLVIEQFGDRCMMYASDYPHWDTEWPHTVNQVVRRKDISDETKQKILADNAKSFYRFS